MSRLTRRSALVGTAAGVAAPFVARALGAGEAPVASTRHGRVRGATEDGVHVFKGVRYGSDTGPRRFQTPRPPESWTGVREALSYGASAPQTRVTEDASEDCLFLNVWTRGLDDAARRPVMVYVHGGAYANGSGSSPLTDGAALARRGDVVVVTLNHRLNVFGYGYFDRFDPPAEWADSGNNGQLDLVLALAWVRDNIAQFGGDPDKVTTFGQSGGGAKIATLMAMPAAAGLFHRAATMSGQQVTASGPLNATRRAQALLDALGLPRARIAELAQMPMNELIEALSAPDPVLGYGSVYFGPTLDFRSLRRHPFYPDAAPQSAGIPMMLGNTKDETRAFLGGDETSFTVTWDELPERLGPELRVDIRPEHVIAEYRRIFPDYSPSEVLFAASTAGRSWRGQVIEAEERAKQAAPTWVYQLDWPSPVDGGKWRAPHGIDIPLVFGTTGAPRAITGDGADARAMAGLLGDAFLAFARSGDPSCDALPAWPQYDVASRATMLFDLPPRVEHDPRGEERRLFSVVPYVQPGT
jgi:para-nitrobenzyl esterase